MVASRRGLLRTAAALAAAALAPRLSAAQTFTATSISEAAQQARRDAGALSRRADSLLRQTAADGFERGDAAVRRFRSDQARLARDLAAIFNSRVSEDDWLLVVPTSELDLVLAMRPLVIRIAPRTEEVEAALKEPLPRLVPQKNAALDEALLAIVLAALGLNSPPDALAGRLKQDGAFAAALTAAAAALRAKRYGLLALELERLMRDLTAARNIAVVAAESGADAPRTLYKALVVRFVPFIGWSFFVTLLLAAVYDNRDRLALAPR